MPLSGGMRKVESELTRKVATMDITIVMLTSVLTAEVNLLHRGLLAVDGRIT